jgi:glycosyltransferase involved in cell wall biosynthesis
VTGPRSLHVVSSLSLASGGPTQSVSRLCEALRAAGAPAEIATVQAPQEELPPAGATPVQAFPVAAPQRLRRAPGLAAFLQAEAHRFDLIHVHGLWEWPGVCARRAALAQGLPLTISPRGMLEPWSLRQRALLKHLALRTWEGRNLAACGLLHATAAAEAAQFRALGLRQDICTIPNPIALPEDPPSGQRERTVLFLSRFHPKKGPDLLLRAWADLQAAFPDWTLELRGPDPDGYRAQLESLATTLELGRDRVRFGEAIHGTAKEALFCRAGLLVLPTHSENFGNVVGEALACGLPVITTTGAPWEGLRDHGCGWWVEPQIEALAAALREALSVPERARTSMGEAGRAWMQRAFSPAAVASQMIQAYGRLIDRARRRP